VVKLPNRLGLITLACRDVARMTQFFRDLGWPETPASDEFHRTFQCTNGCVIALYDARHYEPELGPVADGFRGVVPSVNVESFDEVRAIYETMKTVDGVELLEEPAEAFWGGGFSWRDPEGNLWDVAWAKGTTFDERGGVTFP
jgi:catechol 2,3-dioxygenase-like lactoylglutathione lyase family enzyme